MTASTLHVLDDTGDTRIEWDKDNPTEVNLAEKHFKELKKKGYLTYKSRRDGSRAEVIQRFDPTVERIVASPQTVGG